MTASLSGKALVFTPLEYRLLKILTKDVYKRQVVGCAIGLPLSKSLYDFLIAGHFPSAVWQFPIISLGVILDVYKRQGKVNVI